MKKYYKTVSILIVSYKSRDKVLNFVKKIPKKFSIFIVDNSNDLILKKKLKNFKNIKFFFHKNEGFAKSLNFLVSKIKTEYFLQISPDIKFNFNDLKSFIQIAKLKKNNFCALGPHFINADKKSHKQSNPNIEIAKVKSIHGSVMFVCKKVFNQIGRFDENFFLYFEETDYCKRGENINMYSFQINKIKVRKQGQTVILKSAKEKDDLSNLLSWHFIWSKFYFYKKNYGIFFSLFYFLPIFIRTVFKVLVCIITQNKNLNKYKFRYLGLINSILDKESNFRI